MNVPLTIDLKYYDYQWLLSASTQLPLIEPDLTVSQHFKSNSFSMYLARYYVRRRIRRLELGPDMKIVKESLYDFFRQGGSEDVRLPSRYFFPC